jgi:hypothetical protein
LSNEKSELPLTFIRKTQQPTSQRALRSHDTSVVPSDEMPLNQRLPLIKDTHPQCSISPVLSVLVVKSVVRNSPIRIILA